MSLGAIGTAAGALLAPVLEQVIGLQWTLAVSGVVLLAVVGALAPSLPDVAHGAARRGNELAPILHVLRPLGLFTGAGEPALERLAAAVVQVDYDTGVTVMLGATTPTICTSCAAGRSRCAPQGRPATHHDSSTR
jgi:hypothetical protein